MYGSKHIFYTRAEYRAYINKAINKPPYEYVILEEQPEEEQRQFKLLKEQAEHRQQELLQKQQEQRQARQQEQEHQRKENTAQYFTIQDQQQQPLQRTQIYEKAILPKATKQLQKEQAQQNKQNNTQYFTIQEPTAPEEAKPPTLTKEEKLKHIKDYLENEELISEERYKQIDKIRYEEEEEEAEILTDAEDETPTETQHNFIFKNEEDVKRHEK